MSDLILRYGTQVHELKDMVPQIAELAEQGLYDRQIGERLGLTRVQVANLRQRNRIPAGNPASRPPKPAPFDLYDEPEPETSPGATVEYPSERPNNATWCALLARADAVWLRRMRVAVCDVLRIPQGTNDEGMILAAQKDRRTAEELAGAYLLRYRAAWPQQATKGTGA